MTLVKPTSISDWMKTCIQILMFLSFEILFYLSILLLYRTYPLSDRIHNLPSLSLDAIWFLIIIFYHSFNIVRHLIHCIHHEVSKKQIRKWGKKNLRHSYLSDRRIAIKNQWKIWNIGFCDLYHIFKWNHFVYIFGTFNIWPYNFEFYSTSSTFGWYLLQTCCEIHLRIVNFFGNIAAYTMKKGPEIS